MIEHNPWNPLTQMIVRRCPVDVDAELITASAASRLMKAAGLEVVKTAYFLYFPERIFTWIGQIENHLEKLPFGGQFAMFSRKSVAPYYHQTNRANNNLYANAYSDFSMRMRV